MARPGFKRWWTRIVPKSCERSTYVLISSLLLILIFWQWRPIATTIWSVEGWAAVMLTAMFWAGWVIALASTFQIDHFELFGLRQVIDALRGAADRIQAFKTPLLYRLVRHPLMFGLLLAFWATPHMTAGHLLFAALSTAYILVGVRLEERDLVTDVRCELRALSPARADADAAPVRRRLRCFKDKPRRLRCARFFATTLKASKP